MKVAINNCYGGFSLSALAVKRIAELTGRECYFFSLFLHRGGFNCGEYRPITIEDASKTLLFYAFDIPNPNEVLISQDNWHLKTDKEKQETNDCYDLHRIKANNYERDSPLLIQVIEELGEKANGMCAQLKIIEIPEGVEWDISEYDGIEHVAEKHRVWC